MEEADFVDLESLYSLPDRDFSAEEFLGKSFAKEIEILENQIKDCWEELNERKKLHKEHISELKDKIWMYRGSLTNPHELKKFSEGDGFQEQRANMVERIGEIERELSEAYRSNWRDKTELRRELRELEKEKQKLNKRRNFMLAFSKKL